MGTGCGNSTGNQATAPGGTPDLAVATAAPPSTDLGVPVDAAHAPYAPPQGGAWSPPPGSRTPVAHAPPAPWTSASSMFAGVNVLDVSTDSGGGVWAVSASKVYYLPPGSSTPIVYDQTNGLARGQYTWQDPYYNGTPSSPATIQVTFASVGGATPGQAIVGNIGAIGDRLVVDARTGAVKSVENFRITTASTPAAFLDDHTQRVVGTHKVMVDLQGNRNGTAYMGGWHGFYAVAGLNGDCQCSSDFEEHQHFVPGSGCDSSPPADGCWDGDVWGLALSPKGDVWAGDRHFVQLLTQGSLGPKAGLMDGQFAAGIDVFPGVRDEVRGLAVDVAGGVWVSSDGNGLAYLHPDSWTPIYWSSATTLPLDYLRGAVIDREGDLWIGTDGAGIARYHGLTNTWTYYTAASGLPDDFINTIYLDQFSQTNRIFVATQKGVTIFEAH
jgi:hypothetical protein